jgi:hypothetical protein
MSHAGIDTLANLENMVRAWVKVTVTRPVSFSVRELRQIL